MSSSSSLKRMVYASEYVVHVIEVLTLSYKGLKNENETQTLRPIPFERAHFCDQEKVIFGQIEWGLFEKKGKKGLF